MESKKIALLTKIAKEFNDSSVTWNLGASGMLYLRGVVTAFDDLDIMVHLNDVDLVKKILSKYAKPSVKIPNEQYKTKVFLEYNIEGIDLDIMAGFTIVNQNQTHYFPLEKKEFETVIIDGVKIFLESIENWYTYYKLMNRDDKVLIIEQYLHKNLSK